MRKVTRVMFTAGCALMLGACAAKEKEQPPAAMAAPVPVAAQPAPTPVLSGTVAENTVTVTATVQAINQKTRMVTLKGADGKTATVHVDDSVQNLAQVKKGDRVVATYYESLAYDVMRAGDAERGVTVAGVAGTAQPGEMPAGVGARAITATAKIKAIDKKHETVTLKGPQGNLKTVKVKNPANLDKVKVGDMVQITYTEALAISVEEAPKKTAKKK
jgi:hypothetical protein